MVPGMTKDTQNALKAIEPMAKVLGIKVSADGHFLYCNGQPIGIEDNSAYATCVEFVLFAAIRHYECANPNKMPRYIEEKFKRYWVTPEYARRRNREDE